MDSVTQALLGAAVQGAVLGKTQGRRALFYGAVLGTLPDLDVVIRYADPVSMMTYHRGFSHSLFVLTALAALLAWLVRLRWPDAPYSGQRLFLAVWLALVTHPVLDAFTVYGTQLFWPIATVPESWAAVFIVDPAYTVPLLGAVLFAAVAGFSNRGIRVLAWALAFSTAYLAFGLGARTLAEHRVSTALQARGIAVTELRAVPMAPTTLLWRVIAKTPDGHYYEAVSSVFDRRPPEWLRQPLNPDVGAALKDAPLHERLRWFTGGWLRYDVIDRSLVVSDLRMGMPGQYIFRFKMAQCDDTGRWQIVTPSSWPSRMAGMAEAPLILRRIVSQEPALPLAAWSTVSPGQASAAEACAR